MADIKTQTSVADELRSAAVKLRDTAYGAPSGPWQSLDGGDRLVALTESGRAWTHVLEEPVGHAGTAEWIALASPVLAEPLAAWLEQAAVWHDETTDVLTDPNHVLHDACGGVAGADCSCFAHPLAVARALNGGGS
jgi:hypothetical protein